MRITSRFSTAAESGFLSTPILAHEGEYYTLENGYLDIDTVRTELSKVPGIQFSGDEDINTLALTVELLDRMRISLRRLQANNPGVMDVVKGSPKQAAERRFDKGRYTFVRIDISRKKNVLRVALSVANPYNVVGSSEMFAKLYAQAVADNIIAIRDALMKEDGFNRLELVEGSGCLGMFAESERHNRIQIEAEKMATCERRTSTGYCSPCNFSCPHYKEGKCVEVTV